MLSLREFERILASEVLGPYHNEVHSALGRTPTATWADGVAASGIRLPADVAAFMLDFLPFEERIVRRDGVRLFSVTYYDGTLASLLDSAERRCRVKYNPRDMSAVFVEVLGRGHLRVPCADLGRPPVTLWEQRAATRALRAEGRRTVDEGQSPRRSWSNAACLPRRTEAARRRVALWRGCRHRRSRRRRLRLSPRRRVLLPTLTRSTTGGGSQPWTKPTLGGRSSCHDPE